jgi:hypothetical protein
MIQRVPMTQSLLFRVTAPEGCVIRPIPCHVSQPLGKLAVGSVVTISDNLFACDGGKWLKLGQACGYVCLDSELSYVENLTVVGIAPMSGEEIGMGGLQVGWM